MISIMWIFYLKIIQSNSYNIIFKFLVFNFMISKITIRISLGNVLNLLASVINKLFMFLLRSFMASSLSLTLSPILSSACTERLWKNSLIAFFEIILSPPRKTFNAARNCTQTSPWAYVEVKFSYKSNGVRISFVFTNNGTTPVGTMAKVSTARNPPNLKKSLSKSLKTSARLCSFFFINIRI